MLPNQSIKGSALEDCMPKWHEVYTHKLVATWLRILGIFLFTWSALRLGSNGPMSPVLPFQMLDMHQLDMLDRVVSN
jgi:hypothetical protein